MKNKYSLIACCLIFITLCVFRVSYSGIRQGQPPLKVTHWDAFGYYAYLPAILIYHDCKELRWLTAIDARYSVTGGDGWQAEKQANGNYVFKYLGGVAIMELPFFLIAHGLAPVLGYPADGFSPPYQYALGFGVIFYCLLAILLLRRVLLTWFTDGIAAFALLMVCLATNFIQYAAVDSGQSHAYIFLLYAVVLWATMQWHRRPSILWMSVIGYTIGLAAICRPTEAVMLFIPLMWDTHTREAAKRKWAMLKQRRTQLIAAAGFGFLGILPQLIYWKSVTGSFVYDVGSKWEFLSPHFRVLFGWEKGWFIYTPITVFFIAGMFFIRQLPFRKSVLWFCLLNIYIIIAWHDWRYGGSYSTRALVQSYPVFALPFAALAGRVSVTRWRIPFYLLCTYLLLVNLFQITQYCSTVLHYNDMNRLYYTHIYLNPQPSPADISLLDNDEILTREAHYQQRVIASSAMPAPVTFPANAGADILQKDLNTSGKEAWLKIEAAIYAPGSLWQSYLHADIKCGDSVKRTRIRLFSPISKSDSVNKYACYIRVPALSAQPNLRIYIMSPFDFKGTVNSLSVTVFTPVGR